MEFPRPDGPIQYDGMASDVYIYNFGEGPISVFDMIPNISFVSRLSADEVQKYMILKMQAGAITYTQRTAMSGFRFAPGFIPEYHIVHVCQSDPVEIRAEVIGGERITYEYKRATYAAGLFEFEEECRLLFDAFIVLKVHDT